MKRKWGLEEENKKEENRDKEERSENGPGESQKKGTLLFTFCQNSFVPFFQFKLFF